MPLSYTVHAHMQNLRDPARIQPGSIYCTVLNFRRSLILQISEIFDRSQKDFNKKF